MTNQIKSLEELRAETEASRIRGEERAAWYQFALQHPSFALEANFVIFREFHHGETMTLQTIEESFPILQGQNKLAEKDKVRLGIEAVEAEKDEVMRLRSLSTDQLRREAWIAQTETPLPESITAENIREMEAPQLRKILNRYGAKMTNLRLHGRG
jgi:hypothetical protein